MTNINRRTVLKGVTASSAAIFGLGGAASTIAAPGGNPGKPEDTPGDGGGPGRGAEKNECTPPNELLAKFEWEGGDFFFEKPADKEGLVNITSVELDEDDEPRAFCWTSEVPIGFISVKHGLDITEHPGDVYSGCVDLSNADHAISNVIFCVRPAQAVLCEVDGGGFNVQTLLDGGPLDESPGAVHVVSDSATTDYASGTVNVAYKQPHLMLSDFTNGEDLFYEFFDNGGSNALPDEVFVIFQTDDQRSDPSLSGDTLPNDEFYVAYRITNLPPGEITGDWQDRHVKPELNGDFHEDEVGKRGWKIDKVNSGNILTVSGVINTASDLKLEPFDRSEDLVSDYDGHVLGVGYGYGNTGEEETLDAYFDDLVVGGTTYDFPVAVPMSASNDDGTITMSFIGDHVGVSASDVVKSSVRVTGPLKVAPTTPGDPPGSLGTFAGSENVTVDGNKIIATFDSADVPSPDFLVSGDFDVDRDQIVSFVAAGEVS